MRRRGGGEAGATTRARPPFGARPRVGASPPPSPAAPRRGSGGHGRQGKGHVGDFPAGGTARGTRRPAGTCAVPAPTGRRGGVPSGRRGGAPRAAARWPSTQAARSDAPFMHGHACRYPPRTSDANAVRAGRKPRSSAAQPPQRGLPGPPAAPRPPAGAAAAAAAAAPPPRGWDTARAVTVGGLDLGVYSGRRAHGRRCRFDAAPADGGAGRRRRGWRRWRGVIRGGSAAQLPHEGASSSSRHPPPLSSPTSPYLCSPPLHPS